MKYHSTPVLPACRVVDMFFVFLLVTRTKASCIIFPFPQGFGPRGLFRERVLHTLIAHVGDIFIVSRFVPIRRPLPFCCFLPLLPPLLFFTSP